MSSNSSSRSDGEEEMGGGLGGGSNSLAHENTDNDGYDSSDDEIINLMCGLSQRW